MPNHPEKKQLPLVLRLAAERLSGIFDLYALTQADRYRTMRRERQEAIRAVVEALLPRVCLQADGLAIVMDKAQTEGKPLTVAALAAAAGIGVRRAKRAIYDLRLAGLLEIKPQWRRRADGGRTLLVMACLRRLTRRFWAALGLWGLYCETVRYMQGRPQIRIRAAVYEITAALGRRVLPLLDGGRRGPPPPETAAAERQRETHNAAFRCLINQHGGKPCHCPTCSAAQLATCQRLAASLA